MLLVNISLIYTRLDTEGIGEKIPMYVSLLETSMCKNSMFMDSIFMNLKKNMLKTERYSFGTI
jgi:hypothetical protein